MTEISNQYSPKVKRAALLISAGHPEEVSRWDAIGNVNEITKALKQIGAYEPWQKDYLESLEELAKESL